MTFTLMCHQGRYPPTPQDFWVSPTGPRPRTDATPDELRASLVVAAMALDELLETGTLQPDPRLRLVESMRNLLLVLDSLTPLPEGFVPPADLAEVVTAIRTARGELSL